MLSAGVLFALACISRSWLYLDNKIKCSEVTDK